MDGGDGRASGIDDVARAAGVSTATVSRALRGLPNVSDATRERIRSAADRLGYVASSSAAGLATGRTGTIGVVVPSVSRWFYTMVLEGVDAVLREANVDLILYNLASRGGDRERAFHRSLLRKRTDALIAIGMDFTPLEREQLLSVGHPVVAVGAPTPGVRDIGVDDRAVTRLAVEHLIGLGHRDIVHLGGADDEGLNTRLPAERRAAFRETMADAGLPVREEWLLVGRFSTAMAQAEMREILTAPGPRPTAVFASSDEMAFGVILAARELGLEVPADLSVIGIDGHDLAEPFGLTTVVQDPVAQGALAARLMLAELGGAEAERREWIHAAHELVVRGSTARLP